MGAKSTAASPTFLHVLDLFLARGAKLPEGIVNYVAKSVTSLGHRRAIISTLVEKFGALASCRSHTQARGDNALHCLLKYNESADTADILKPLSFLVENGCDVPLPKSSGDTPLQVAIENGYLSVARGVLPRISQLYSYVDRLKPFPGDGNGNGIFHRLCRRSDDRFPEKVKLLQEARYDVARNINWSNNKGFTPLGIALRNTSSNPATISCLLGLGDEFAPAVQLNGRQ